MLCKWYNIHAQTQTIMINSHLPAQRILLQCALSRIGRQQRKPTQAGWVTNCPRLLTNLQEKPNLVPPRINCEWQRKTAQTTNRKTPFSLRSPQLGNRHTYTHASPKYLENESSRSQFGCRDNSGDTNHSAHIDRWQFSDADVSDDNMQWWQCRQSLRQSGSCLLRPGSAKRQS